MEKELSEMTLEELWQLFPIRLVPHDPMWKEQYRREAERLNALLGSTVARVNHIGSTAVPHLAAKPIVDILIEVFDAEKFEKVKRLLLESGRILMSENGNPLRASFNKGYMPEGFAAEVFHYHLRIIGDCKELYFRDYLIAHPETAEEYARLKFSLAGQYEHNRDAYTDAKTDFVNRVTAMAMAENPGRYGASISSI